MRHAKGWAAVLVLGVTGCAQPAPTVSGPTEPAALRAQEVQIQQRGQNRMVRRNRDRSRRPSWWGSHRWERRSARPAWWGNYALLRNRFILVNGYYFPFYVYGGYYYPEYTEPYLYHDGRFEPANEAPFPAQHAYDRLDVNQATVVTVNANERVDR